MLITKDFSAFFIREIFLYDSAASTDEDTVLFTQDDIACDFLDQHIDCCKHFSQLQSSTIAHNLELYGHMGQAEMKTLGNLQELCVDHYIGLTQLKPIKNDKRVIASNQKVFGEKQSIF